MIQEPLPRAAAVLLLVAVCGCADPFGPEPGSFELEDTGRDPVASLVADWLSSAHDPALRATLRPLADMAARGSIPHGARAEIRTAITANGESMDVPILVALDLVLTHSHSHGGVR